ncbi:MAG: hypothetical protein RLN69_05455, partial [Woeseiaceae bacterium]
MDRTPFRNPADTRSPVHYDGELIARYGGRGPRYTSYPTAMQFAESFAAHDYERNAVECNSSGRPLSLYVHIPFCRSLCYYCACNKIITRNDARVRTYLQSLHKEIRMQSELFDRGRTVEQMHFGGGTPTYLSADQLADLLECHLKNGGMQQGIGRLAYPARQRRTASRG